MRCHRSSRLHMMTNTYLQEVLLYQRHTGLAQAFSQSEFHLRLRYYLVGEYGDTTERPHYHICLFGYPPCAYGQTRLFKNERPCCAWCSGLQDTWSQGNVFSAELNELSIQYCAGYVTKKMTSHEDIRLNGRHPEFARMSNRPGIGVPALQFICEYRNVQSG